MLTTDSDTVLFKLDEFGVLTLTLNRPARNNAWNSEMEQAFHSLLVQASASSEVRAIVLTGGGRSFCPGVDSEDLQQLSQTGGSNELEGRLKLYLPSLVPKPVVCAINGGCAGFGLITALCCDVRFAGETVKITTAFARRGLPAEEAVSWILPRIVGHATALDLLISGRVVTGAEAAQIGLVHEALPAEELLARAHDYARDVATNCSPRSMASVKRQIYKDWERSYEDSRLDARHLLGVLRSESGDFREGVASFVERRAPAFEPLSVVLDPADLYA